MASHSVLLPGKSHGQRSLWSMGSLSVRHDWATLLSLFTFMHWRRKWQPTPVFLPGESRGGEEPGGLPSMGLHRVGHDWSDLAAAAAAAAAFSTTLSQLPQVCLIFTLQKCAGVSHLQFTTTAPVLQEGRINVHSIHQTAESQNLNPTATETGPQRWAFLYQFLKHSWLFCFYRHIWLAKILSLNYCHVYHHFLS